jgi:hypothetical protein
MHQTPDHALLERLEAVLREISDVQALLVVGSVARGTADYWSDLDVVVVVTDAAFAAFDPATRWLGQIGEVLAFEHYPGSGRGTTRAWLDEGRLDIVVATETCFTAEDGWPLWDGIAVRFSRSPLVDQVVAAPHARPAAQLLTLGEFEALVNQFWFQALMALTKVVHGDLLIGLHLCLEVVQVACILGMALRDRETGTTIHTSGGMGNELAQQFLLPQPIPTAASILDCLHHTGRVFDALAATWSPTYHPRFDAFERRLAGARAVLVAAER